VHFESWDIRIDRAGWRQEVGGDRLAKRRRQAGEEDQTGDDRVRAIEIFIDASFAATPTEAVTNGRHGGADDGQWIGICNNTY